MPLAIEIKEEFNQDKLLDLKTSEEFSSGGVVYDKES